MKIHLKFNHDEKDSLRAIDCQYTGEQVNDRIVVIMDQYICNDEISKQSHLCELIHDTLDYEEILFLASHSLQNKALKFAIKKISKDIEDYLDL